MRDATERVDEFLKLIRECGGTAAALEEIERRAVERAFAAEAAAVWAAYRRTQEILGILAARRAPEPARVENEPEPVRAAARPPRPPNVTRHL